MATSGKSFLESIDILRSEGFKVDTAVCIVDRQEGAKEALAKKTAGSSRYLLPKTLE